ncbi:MAG TPA: hypothetical protein VHT75_16065 [Acidimicrobiales bacterium]|jgi:hypothetical protein|nr:hypothetical protein [Acidimicrobiales bacterium]
MDPSVSIGHYLGMRVFPGARLLIPAALMTAVLAGGCGGGGTTGPSKDKVRTTTAADVTSVLHSHGVDVKGAITCFGQAPGIIDCHGTSSDGKDIQATLTAATSGLSCTGPMVVNVNKTQLVSLPDEKCS